MMSEYHFRGVLQSTTATANSGFDYENGGFYAGTWAADVDDGLEIDFYGGYGFDLTDGVSVGLGFTLYEYTGDFDSGYSEVNFSLSAGMFSLEVSSGEQDESTGLGIAGGDYTFTALTVEGESGLYATYGSWSGDLFEDSYLELGYGTTIDSFDVGVALVFADDDLDVATGGDGQDSLVFTIGKSFDL